MRNCAGVSARVGKSWLVAEEVVRVSWGERGGFVGGGDGIRVGFFGEEGGCGFGFLVMVVVGWEEG